MGQFLEVALIQTKKLKCSLTVRKSFTTTPIAVSPSRRLANDRGLTGRCDYDYNERNEVITGTKSNDNGTAFEGLSFGFDYDDLGNRISSRIDNAETSYQTNDLNQYTQRNHSPGTILINGEVAPDAQVTVNGELADKQTGQSYWSETLTADTSQGGAWLPVDVVATNTQDVAVESGHIYLPPETFNPTYDEDGNLTNDGRWTYTWNGENRLIKLETTAIAQGWGVPKTKLEFIYDATGRRTVKTVSRWDEATANWVAPTTNHFLYDGWNIIAEIIEFPNGTTGWSQFVWGTDLVNEVSGNYDGPGQGAGGVGGLVFGFLSLRDGAQNQSSVCYGFDANGNVSGLVRAVDGSMAAKYDYTPFGKNAFASGPVSKLNPFTFSTKWKDDESGLHYYGFRYYDSETGRWPSRDPIEERGGVATYSFISNQPTSPADLLGMSKIPREGTPSPNSTSEPTTKRQTRPNLPPGPPIMRLLKCALALDSLTEKARNSNPITDIPITSETRVSEGLGQLQTEESKKIAKNARRKKSDCPCVTEKSQVWYGNTWQINRASIVVAHYSKGYKLTGEPATVDPPGMNGIKAFRKTFPIGKYAYEVDRGHLWKNEFGGRDLFGNVVVQERNWQQRGVWRKAWEDGKLQKMIDTNQAVCVEIVPIYLNNRPVPRKFRVIAKGSNPNSKPFKKTYTQPQMYLFRDGERNPEFNFRNAFNEPMFTPGCISHAN